LENFNDPDAGTELTKGKLKGFWKSHVRIKMVSCRDVGKAAAAVISTEKWIGQTIDCVSCYIAGDECAHALSDASGVTCTYSIAVPSVMQTVLNQHVHDLADFFETGGFESSIQDFLEIVPDAQGAKEYFESIGQWSNGEIFKNRLEAQKKYFESPGSSKDDKFNSSASVPSPVETPLESRN
jgi:hypothetical protein